MPSEKAVPMSRAGVAREAEIVGGARSITGRMFEWFLRVMGNPPIRAVLWTGETFQTGTGEPVATIEIGDRGTLLRLILHSELEFGEAYSEGRLRVDGDLEQLLEAMYSVRPRPWAERLLRRAGKPRANTHSGSRDNIHRHYDLGNDFYRLWLDREMVYTCAYYPSQEATLEEAQVAKMEYVCRKIALGAGERVVEAGCGWGALALYMARTRGARVRAFNISSEQIAFARERARAEGLADRVEFVEDDYRNISGDYDAFVSVGMLEHVGPEHYRELGRVIDRTLPAHGRGLIHSIGRDRPMRVNAWIERRIFPGSYPPALGQMMEIFESNELSVLDVENLRLHYARTCAEWLRRFEAHVEELRARFDERFLRAWRLYLAGSTAAFSAATLQLFQVVFARTAFNGSPWTRAHLYD